jgi:hypothetical protein
MNAYETVTEALADLKKRNYTIDFNIAFDKIICSDNKITLSPTDFEIVETYRFEGDTNPSDEDVVYAIESKDVTVKGTMTSAYGMYADKTSSQMLEKLSTHK